MDKLVEYILFVIIVLYVYWVGPALVLLNWLLARYLGTRVSSAPIVASCLIISLLLLGPIKSRGGGFVFGHDIYYPWYFGGSSLKLDNAPWVALLTLCAVSVVITVATLSNRKLSASLGIDQSAKH